MKKKYQIKDNHISTGFEDADETIELTDEEYKAKLIELDELREAEKLANMTLKERRMEAYRAAISNDEFQEAIFEKFAGDSTKLDSFQAIRQQIKIDIT